MKEETPVSIFKYYDTPMNGASSAVPTPPPGNFCLLRSEPFQPYKQFQLPTHSPLSPQTGSKGWFLKPLKLEQNGCIYVNSFRRNAPRKHKLILIILESALQPLLLHLYTSQKLKKHILKLMISKTTREREFLPRRLKTSGNQCSTGSADDFRYCSLCSVCRLKIADGTCSGREVCFLGVWNAVPRPPLVSLPSYWEARVES